MPTAVSLEFVVSTAMTWGIVLVGHDMTACMGFPCSILVMSPIVPIHLFVVEEGSPTTGVKPAYTHIVNAGLVEEAITFIRKSFSIEK